MRLISIATILAGTTLAVAANAQPTSDPTSGPAPAQASPAMPAPAAPAPAPAAPDPTAASPAADQSLAAPVPSAQGSGAAAYSFQTQPAPVQQMAPAAPVVQAAPPAAGAYPPCTKGLKDSCTNPGESRKRRPG